MNATGYKPRSSTEQRQERLAEKKREMDEAAAKEREATRALQEQIQRQLDRHLGTK